jgi:hypothetical protein
VLARGHAIAIAIAIAILSRYSAPRCDVGPGLRRNAQNAIGLEPSIGETRRQTALRMWKELSEQERAVYAERARAESAEIAAKAARAEPQ